MFDDYKTLVLRDYQMKKERNLLSINLINPTPAAIKSACIRTCDKGILPGDRKFLEDFFGYRQDASAYQKAIKNFDTSKFKPLCNFLKRNTNQTADKNIELLAWLIDFEKRPYKVEPTEPAPPIQQVPSNLTPLPDHKAPDHEGASSENFPSGTLQATALPAPLKHYKKSVTLSALILTIALGCFILGKMIGPLPLTSQNEQCMYWTGDCYQPVSCNRKMGSTTVYALDSEKVAHLKRITKPDTITKKSIGRVWYSKINNKVEFFTSPGVHPVHTSRILKPITPYIIAKYISHASAYSHF